MNDIFYFLFLIIPLFQKMASFHKNINSNTKSLWISALIFYFATQRITSVYAYISKFVMFDYENTHRKQ